MQKLTKFSSAPASIPLTGFRIETSVRNSGFVVLRASQQRRGTHCHEPETQLTVHAVRRMMSRIVEVIGWPPATSGAGRIRRMRGSIEVLCPNQLMCSAATLLPRLRFEPRDSTAFAGRRGLGPAH